MTEGITQFDYKLLAILCAPCTPKKFEIKSLVADDLVPEKLRTMSHQPKAVHVC